jgi:phosphatidylinositol alpha-mannosyltransferase
MSAKSKLTIGYVLDDSIDSTDGVQQYVKTVSDWMMREGHDCHFIVGHSDSEADNVHSMSRVVKLKFNHNSVATPVPARSKRIHALLAAQTFDVLHVQMPYSPLLAGKIIANAPQKTAVVGTFHILPYGKLNRHANTILARTLRSSLGRFDDVVSVSPAAQAFAKSVYGVNSDVVPNAVDTAKFVTKRSLKAEKRPARIVFLGRLVERKGVRELLAALVALQTSHPQVASQIECIIAGSGKLEISLKNYAKRHKIDHIVHFTGFVPEEDKPQLLASADVAVFPALGGESFGIVLIEAMAAGARVVIGGDNPGYRSVLGERKELLVDARNTQAFAAALLKLLTDNKLREDVHRWQQRTIRQYDIAQVGPKLLSCYQSAIQKRKKG